MARKIARICIRTPVKALGTAIAMALLVFGVLGPKPVAAQGSTALQIHLDHWRNGCTANGNNACPQESVKWIDGNLHGTNSTYTEGDFVPTRFVIDNLPRLDSNSNPIRYTLTFQWLAAKAQGGGDNRLKHAHDYLSTYNKFAAASYNVNNDPPGKTVDPCDPRVQGGGNGPNACSGVVSVSRVPTDPELIPTNPKPWEWDGGVPTPPNALTDVFSMWNGTIMSVSSYTYHPDVPYSNPSILELNDVTTYNQISVSFTVNDNVPAGEGVVLALGARLAVDEDWNHQQPGRINGDGACDIHGSPYHWAYELVNEATGESLQSGSRDRSIMCEGERAKFSLSLVKACYIGETLFEGDQSFNFEGSSPDISPNPFDPSQFSVNCSQFSSGGSMWTFTQAGTYSIKELADQLGWELREISCVDTGTTNPANATYTGATESPSNNFEPGDDTANVTFSGGGGDVTCTFGNYQAEMPLNKLIDGQEAVCTPVLENNEPVYDQFGNQVFERPCTFDVGTGLTLDNSDPRFTFDLYYTDTPDESPGDLSFFPDPAVVSAKVPPLFELPGLIGVPLTLCEEPSSPYTLADVTVNITHDGTTDTFTSDNPTSNLSAIYTMELNNAVMGKTLIPDADHTFPAGTYSCFDILVPNGTTKFEILANNRPSITLTKECIPSDDTSSTFDLQVGDETLMGANCGDSIGPVPVSFETITVGESNANPPLNKWFTEISCSPVAATNRQDGENSVTWDVDLTQLDPDQTEACTITNSRKFCTITQGGWFAPPAGGNWASLLSQEFSSVYSSLVVGDNGGPYTLTFTSSDAVAAASPGGTPGVLDGNQTDPCGDAPNPADATEPGACHLDPAGNFASQMVALKINVDFSAADLFPDGWPGFGDLTVTGTGTSLDGKTVSEILALANTALGGGGFPAGFDASSLAGFLANLNESYDGCQEPTDWAKQHLQ